MRERPALGAGEKLANRHPIAIRANRRIGRLEQVDEDSHDLLRLGLLHPRDTTLLGQRPCLQRRDDPECGDAGGQHRCRGDGEAVPAHELARTVAKGVGLGKDGAAVEEAFDLLCELACGPVAAFGFIAQRRHYNPVEVAANPSGELAAIGDP